ncbi:hypothetical protein GUJ93_ZPchr0465g6482 [Zizania palustris]|uniref:CASP-like protein n=1 Tax=Zizania palustris TaxID=103762 RepID=A0A8J5RBJ2_ZIZPA|nr:hypothetical protein GUJ93_ZPchr0465g6482 [Zizania palustris]
MWELAWRPGTWGGLALRVGQVAFAAASIGVMASGLGFANYTAFCYLIASMGLQSLWSLGLACLDGYALKVKRDLNNALLVSLFVIGDWVTALLSFAASCSAAGVIVLFKRDVLFCRSHYHVLSPGFILISRIILYEVFNHKNSEED